ncbi:MAG: 1-(5-phosphoribosyl)-5-[(5-phosphoribosylamino)methylideneamino]imidazole-4-carboxamide isomerase [Aquificaceae bacterium]
MQSRIIPAIDLLEGNVVRLKEGDFSKVRVYSDKPHEIARKLSVAGFETLHVVDLKGSLTGSLKEIKVLEAIRESFKGTLQFGGGIRTKDDIKTLDTIGVDRFVIGTLALKNRELFIEIVRRMPNRVVLSIDSKGGKVATDGWSFQSHLSPQEIIRHFDELEIWGYLSTEIEKDGTMTGVNPESYRTLRASTSKPIIASGGVSSIEDIKSLLKVADFVVVGKALYEGRLSPWDNLFEG